MSPFDVRLALKRIGSASPIVLVTAYTFSVLVVTGIHEIVRGSIAGSMFITILIGIVLSLLFVTVTWFRDDDWLAAGVLMTLTIYSGVAVQGLLLVVFRGGIGPAALWSAVTVGGAIVYAIIFAPIAGGLVALARKLTRNLRAPLPDTR